MTARETAKADVRETLPVPEVVAEITAALIAEKTARHQAEVALLLAKQETLEAQVEREAVAVKVIELEASVADLMTKMGRMRGAAAVVYADLHEA